MGKTAFIIPWAISLKSPNPSFLCLKVKLLTHKECVQQICCMKVCPHVYPKRLLMFTKFCLDNITEGESVNLLCLQERFYLCNTFFASNFPLFPPCSCESCTISRFLVYLFGPRNSIWSFSGFWMMRNYAHLSGELNFQLWPCIFSLAMAWWVFTKTMALLRTRTSFPLFLHHIFLSLSLPRQLIRAIS